MQLFFSLSVLYCCLILIYITKQCVVIQGKQSDLYIQERGVPHGSILIPLIFPSFSIFINDLPLVLSHYSFHLYADNTVTCISNPHLTQIQNIIQSDSNALQAEMFQSCNSCDREQVRL